MEFITVLFDKEEKEESKHTQKMQSLHCLGLTFACFLSRAFLSYCSFSACTMSMPS